MATAGRWSILERGNGIADVSSANAKRAPAEQPSGRTFAPAAVTVDPESVEKIARIFLKRYGVVFKRLLEREGVTIPWRLLLRTYHRLEARGEIRGGRFVAGISGEQFALPEAVGLVRSIRRATRSNEISGVLRIP